MLSTAYRLQQIRLITHYRARLSYLYLSAQDFKLSLRLSFLIFQLFDKICNKKLKVGEKCQSQALHRKKKEWWGAGAFPSRQWAQAGLHPGQVRSQSHRQPLTLTPTANSESQIRLRCTCLGLWEEANQVLLIKAICFPRCIKQEVKGCKMQVGEEFCFQQAIRLINDSIMSCAITLCTLQFVFTIYLMFLLLVSLSL